MRRVLIVQPYGIGDLLFITPVLRALRLVPSVERVDLLLGSRTDVVVRNNPHVDEIFSVDKDLFHRQGNLKTFRDVLALGKKLRSRRYDLLLDYSLRGEYGFFSQFFLGIPKRAGFDYKRRGYFHNIRIPLPRGFHGRHVADFCCDLAEKAGVPVEDRWLEFYPIENVARRKDLENRFLAVSLGGGESWGKDAHFKRWPVKYFVELIQRLAPQFDYPQVVLLGSAGERMLGEELAAKLPKPILNLAGEISLEESAAILSRAALFLGNDGGLMHLAHALRVPVIALFGPVDPAVYGPYPRSEDAIAVFKEDLDCRPCYQKFRYKSDCPHRDCLQAFTADEVLQFLEARSFLSAFSQP